VQIVLTENCTADGVIDMAAGWFDPADQTDDHLVAVTQAHMAEQDALLLGRSTFEAFRRPHRHPPGHRWSRCRGP
jgi:dihydrofolate reductase